MKVLSCILLLSFTSIFAQNLIRLVPDPAVNPDYCVFTPCCDISPNATYPHGIIMENVPVPSAGTGT